MSKTDSADENHDDLDKKVAGRAAEFAQSFLSIKREHPNFFSNTFLNNELLALAVRSYFHDIERLKEFHEIEFADRHKKFGFSLNWICKIRPVQVFESKKFTDEAHYLLNEMYAFHCGAGFLEIPDDYTYDANAWQAFMYSLRYRNISGEYLSLMAYLIEQNADMAKKLNDFDSLAKIAK